MRVGSELNDKGMACWVYRSPRKDEMYLYIAQEDDFTCVPDALLERFGVPVRVMEIALSDQRKLAREDVAVVMENLRSQGFHLQIPPKIDVNLYAGD
ncbi:MAG: YcgL domain-containing protein [Candidatus Thiodiazotropha sp. (ex Lucinoma borealis)]|nr:YcgL domain-containing protein [Candidatus Thiodiazotropha sp. (ex Lucinoma borealis)]MCU7857249.1 YcgL domain-containing protein [Candidatus Thiodiazotropha sp. (ex Lucinoma borealis)]MCU7868674.1 YcgL domain-containing protein [Candidatus Thiodiazotropha sp. (ex Lucinoma borealis)]MCU7872350.1 YcgL domain-containing protein [Candidatus Thiodiazotropha sp. (ex Lucinoma borealis)]